jgi:hypothetical protein
MKAFSGQAQLYAKTAKDIHKKLIGMEQSHLQSSIFSLEKESVNYTPDK